jgi:predicted Zn finger-like uncharacterized protein
MQITCKRCGAEILSKDINLDQMVAKCTHCNAVFSIAKDMDGEHGRNIARPETPMPKGFSVEGGTGDLQITRPWLSGSTGGLTVACLIWNGIIAVWYGMAITQSQWLLAACGLIPALAGLGFAYGAVAGYLNKTVITVNSSGLEVKSGPIPAPGNKRLETMNLKQLYTKEIMSRSRVTSYRYQVRAINSENQDQIVVDGLTDPMQALYIEQEIERSLGIKDRPVRGEMPR